MINSPQIFIPSVDPVSNLRGPFLYFVFCKNTQIYYFICLMFNKQFVLIDLKNFRAKLLYLPLSSLHFRSRPKACQWLCPNNSKDKKSHKNALWCTSNVITKSLSMHHHTCSLACTLMLQGHGWEF